MLVHSTVLNNENVMGGERAGAQVTCVATHNRVRENAVESEWADLLPFLVAAQVGAAVIGATAVVGIGVNYRALVLASALYVQVFGAPPVLPRVVLRRRQRRGGSSRGAAATATFLRVLGCMRSPFSGRYEPGLLDVTKTNDYGRSLFPVHPCRAISANLLRLRHHCRRRTKSLMRLGDHGLPG